MTQFAIIGAGAIGCAVAHKLLRSGHQVAFVGRSGPIDVDFTIREDAEVFSYRTSSNSSALKAARVVFLSLKAYDLAKAWQNHRHHFAKGAVVITLANGFIKPWIEENAQDQSFIWRMGSIDIGSRTEIKSTYVLSNPAARLRFGPVGSNPPALTPDELLLLEPNSFFEWHENITQACQRKWLFNVVINTSAAFHRLPRNGLLIDGDTTALRQAFEEAMTLGKDVWGSWDFDKELMWQELITLIKNTAQNENSMARDVRLNKPTESSFLAGLAKDEQRYPLLNLMHRKITSY